MSSEKTIKATGVLAITDFKEATFSHAAVEAAFKAVGLDKYAPNKHTKLACLKKALTALYTVRNTGDGVAYGVERCGDGYVVNEKRPDPATHRVDTAHKLAAWIEIGGADNLPVMRCDDITEWAAINEAMETAASRIEADAVSKALVDVLCSTTMQAVPLRRVGGIYWLPVDTADKWRTLASGIEGACVGGSARCWSITTVGDVESVRAVADAFVREMEEEIAKAEAAILAGEMTGDKLNEMADRLMDKQELGDKFAGLLGTSLETITNRLDEIRVRAAQAASLVG
jgi:hypothetical protein